MALVEGQPIGNYRILSRIGSGGMGAVYLAEHAAIGKKVAIKVIHRDLATSREVIGRFYQEARSVASIGNEHIIEVHDYGQSNEGDHFIVMELVDGQTLAQVLERERVLDLGRAMHIAAQIADGLGAVHAAGIIHRDLKPDNVMLCKKAGDPDFVKLLDFGLAKVLAEGGVKGLTQAGVILGTPQYMSPEACESKKVDHRTDIYALGVMLFQMVTGQVPFDGPSMGAVLIKQVTEAPPAPRALMSTVPPALEQLILRCLAKSPAARFQTMQEVIDALIDPARYLNSSPPMMPASSPPAPAAAKVNATMVISVAPPSTSLAPRTSGQQAASAPRVSAPQVVASVGGAPGAAPQQAPYGGGPPPGPYAGQGGAVAPPGDGLGSLSNPALSMQPPPGLPVQRPAALPVPANQTMMISTPPGFKSHPPRRALPLVIAGGAIAVVGAIVAVVLVMSGGGTKEGPGPFDSGLADAHPALRTNGTPDPTQPGSGSAATLAHIQINTEPPGAEVFDAQGNRLGVTPTEIGVPADGAEHALTFRHPGRRERQKTIVASGDMTVTVVLEKQ